MTDKLFTGVSEADIKAKQQRAAKITAAERQAANELREKQQAAERAKKLQAEKSKRIEKLNRASQDMKSKVAAHMALTGTLALPTAVLASGILGLIGSVRTDTYVEEEWVDSLGREVSVEYSYVHFGETADIMLSGYSYKHAKEHDMLWSFWANMVVTTLLFGVCWRKFIVNPELGQELSDYGKAIDVLSQSEFTFENFEDAMHKANKTAVLNVIQNLSKQDRKLFDDFMANPTDIHKQELAIAVVRGHLMTNPNDLDRLFNTFSPESIPDEIRQAYETIRQSNKKVITWEQALAQYNQGKQQ